MHGFRMLIAIGASLTAILIQSAGVHAIGVSNQLIKQQKVVGGYTIVLQIGPAEMMSMNHHASSGEVMVAGKNATCAMKGMSGMGVSIPDGMHSKTCNHHVEVHVYKGRKVITSAKVSIAMRDSKKHMTLQVPIMTMMGAHMGASDFHYGNNVYAGSGTYTVTVGVSAGSALAARFTVQLM